MHVSDCTSDGHAAPEPDGVTLTERVRVREPPPQLALQEPHTPHSDTWQSTFVLTDEQLCVLHDSVSTISPQLAPPPVGCWVTTFWRARTPEPHDRVH